MGKRFWILCRVFLELSVTFLKCFFFFFSFLKVSCRLWLGKPQGNKGQDPETAAPFSTHHGTVPSPAPPRPHEPGLSPSG